MNITPTPWTVEHLTLKNARGESIASAGNNRKVGGTELAASLRLAAAAPELLVALQELLKHVPVPRVAMGNNFDDPFPLPDYIKQARAAITKATNIS